MADIRDIKVGNTKYNIKLPSSRIKSMADYAKPSSKPSPEAIQQSDTLNAALGKLEYKADTNKANIEYDINTGARNLMPVKSGTNSQSYKWVTGEIGTDHAEQNSIAVYIPAGTYNFKATTNSDSGTSKVAQLKFVLSDGTYVLSDPFEIAATCGVTFTVDNDVKSFGLYCGTYPVTFDNMRICPTVVDDSEYIEPAISNSDLTILEAEDRAALAEVVDSGAKNLIYQTTLTTNPDIGGTGLGITVNPDGSFVLNGTTNTTINGVRLGYYYGKSGSLVISGASSKVAFRVRDINNTVLVDTNLNAEFVSSTGGDILLWGIGKGVTFNNEKYFPMVSEKAAFEISQKSVPYALPNTVISPELIELVDSGPKNILQLPPISTWTINSNVTATVSGNEVTVSRTSSSSTAGIEIPLEQTIPTNCWVILSGCPANGSDSTYRIDAFDNGTLINTSVDTGTGSTAFKFSTTTQKIRIRFAANTSYTNLKFNLMLCTKAAWDVSPKFVPYQAIPKVICNSRTEFTSATTMTYTGVSYYIPPYTSVRVTANLLNSHGNPIEAAIVSYANQNIYIAHNEMPTDKTIGCNTVSFIYTTTDSGYTVAVLAKYSNATTNYVHLVAEKLN